MKVFHHLHLFRFWRALRQSLLLALSVGCYLALLPIIHAQVLVQFSQTSDPAGLITATSTMVATGSVVSTVAAPASNSGYQFAYWTFNSSPMRDQLGQSINPVNFTITLPITAVATYLSTTADLNSNNIPDSFELFYCSSLTNGPNANSDGDGFTLIEEYTRDYNPNIPDKLLDGGFSQRNSTLMPFVTAGYVVYTEVSTPFGLVNNQLILVTNTTRILPDVSAAGLASGYQFAEWRTNNVRVADTTGCALAGLSILVNANTTNATAVFFPSGQDTLGDGVPDWFKFQFYGTANVPSSTNTDADVWTLLDEYLRDYNPNYADVIVDGGFSQRNSTLTSYIIPGYVLYTEVSTPSGFVNNQFILATNTTRILPDVSAAGLGSGYQFVEWCTNGVRMADVTGRSIGGLSILVTEATTNATAVFLSMTQDTLGDGVPDWFKYQFYGMLTNASSDGDADGFTLLDEYQRDYNPLAADIILDGGISQRNSAQIFVDTRPYAYYWIYSSPEFFVPVMGQVPVGTVIQTTNIVGGTSGYLFGHWSVNGTRQQDAQGFALNQVTFTVYSNTVVIAVYHDPTVDSDYDGMPDWWEDQYLGGPTIGNPSADADGDGMGNLAEYLAGTNPRDAKSLLSISDFRRAPDGFEISFSSISGKTYLVQFSTNLTLSSEWQILPVDGNTNGVAGTGGTIQIVDPTATNDVQRFYRVKLKQ